MRELNPKRQKNGGFVVYFRNPLRRGKTVTVGLGTRDEIIARSICRDAVLIFNNEDVLLHPTPEKIVGYDPLAVKMVFGEEMAARLLEKADAIQQPIGREEASQIWQAVEMMGHDSRRILRRGEPDETVKPWSIYLRKVGYSPKNYEMLIGLCERQRKELVVTRDENTRLRAELEKLTKKHNVNIKTTIAEAFKEFQEHYKADHADQTYRENVSFIAAFIQFLPEVGQTRLGTIDTGDIDRWVDSLKGENGQMLRPRTKRNRRNGVSTFFSFAISRFGLGDNPLSRCRPIAGVTRQMNEIRAIDRQADLSALFKALENESYWKAWVMFAIFAGPRFSEQKHCKLSDVYIGDDGNYVKLKARKTGRIRNVPIERTALLPVLKAHFARRKFERDHPEATENEKSEWLFPAIVPSGKKVKSLPGTWSSNFLFNWAKAVARVGSKPARLEATAYIKARRAEAMARKKAKQAGIEYEPQKVPVWKCGDFWEFGPREWRHSFGTALAHCGFSALEISYQMDNSPKVAQTHYIKSSSQGSDKRWPFKW